MDNITETSKTKIVHIGKMSFEIPAHMTMSAMAECWKDDSESFEALAKTIVETNARFAWQVVSAWLEKHGQLMIDKDFHGYIHTPAELEKMVKRHSKTKKANQS
jgi:hypothetical protein